MAVGQLASTPTDCLRRSDRPNCSKSWRWDRRPPHGWRAPMHRLQRPPI